MPDLPDLKLRDAAFAVMSLREATLPPNDRGKPQEYAEGWTDGYNDALAKMREAIAAALGGSGEAPHVQ